MQKKRGLNLGLSELLSDIKTVTTNATADVASTQPKSALRNMPVDMLKPGKYQPRKEMNQETLTELADSIRVQGIIQPIVARPLSAGNYEIIAGERRWRAAQLANLHEVPVIVRELTNDQAIALSLIENIQREDLNAIDTATSLKQLMHEFNLTHEEVATTVGKSRTTVTNLLRLLELPDSIKEMIQAGKLEMGHARALLTLDLKLQLAAAKKIIDGNLSVRATENLVRQLQNPRPPSVNTSDANISQLAKGLSDTLAASVQIQHAKNGKGKLIINYNSLDELEGIMEHIK